MFIILLFLFTILPALELFLLIKVGTYIGALNTISIIILTGVTGAALARYQGFIVISRIQNELAKGNLPNSELFDGALILAGGILLLTPGFITDILGLVLLFPLTRALFKGALKWWIALMMKQGRFVYGPPRPPRESGYDDIDVN